MRAGAAEKPCRLCTGHDFSEDAMRPQIDAYLAALPEELLVAEEAYARRLAACYGCQRQTGGMCVLCGCYVRVRAAKKTQACPDVGQARWGREMDAAL